MTNWEDILIEQGRAAALDAAPSTEKETPQRWQIACPNWHQADRPIVCSWCNGTGLVAIYLAKDIDQPAPPRAEALARKEKVNEDSTMPTLQRAAQDGVDTESRTRDDARHQRGEGTLSKDAGIPEVALTPHPILTNDELHAVDVALQAGSCPFSLRGKVIQALGLRAAALARSAPAETKEKVEDDDAVSR